MAEVADSKAAASVVFVFKVMILLVRLIDSFFDRYRNAQVHTRQQNGRPKRYVFSQKKLKSVPLRRRVLYPSGRVPRAPWLTVGGYKFSRRQ